MKTHPFINGGIGSWNIERDPRSIKTYLRLVTRVLKQMEDLPENDRVEYAFFSHLQSREIGKQVGKKILRKVLRVLIPRQPYEAAALISIEVSCNGTKRFTLDEICKWLDLLSVPHSKGCQSVHKILSALKDQKIEIPKEKVLAYCRNSIQEFGYRSAGNTLFEYGLHMDPSIDTAKEVYEWTKSSANYGDHGIARMFPILLLRIQQARPRYVKVHTLTAVAGILHDVYMNRRVPDCTVSILLQTAWECFPKRCYKRLLAEYRKMLRATHLEQRAGRRESLRVGNFGRKQRPQVR